MQKNSNLKLIISLENQIEDYAIEKARTLNIHLVTFERIKEIGRSNPKNPRVILNLDLFNSL